MRLSAYGILLLCTCVCGAAFAKGTPEWKEAGNAYKTKTAVPVKSMALSAVNIDVGVNLERLTLLSGEGHTGKKVASGLLAGGLTVLGLGGVDTAAREPIEEHLTEDEARKIASDVAQIVSDHFKKMSGMKVYAGEEVTSAPWYAGLAGSSAIDKKKKTVQDGRWSPEYYFGYYSTPAAGYKYSPPAKFSFGDKSFSPVIRQNLGADATVAVNVFLVNTRADFRIQEMTIILNGLSWSGQTNGDTQTLSFVLNDAGGVSVPVDGSSNDNYAAWLNLRPQFEAKIEEVVQKIRAAIPVAP